VRTYRGACGSLRWLGWLVGVEAWDRAFRQLRQKLCEPGGDTKRLRGHSKAESVSALSTQTIDGKEGWKHSIILLLIVLRYGIMW
jgi:hypothetical protein